jgi:hypothetical protein
MLQKQGTYPTKIYSLVHHFLSSNTDVRSQTRGAKRSNEGADKEAVAQKDHDHQRSKEQKIQCSLHGTNRLGNIGQTNRMDGGLSIDALKIHIMATIEINWKDIARRFDVKKDLKSM